MPPLSHPPADGTWTAGIDIGTTSVKAVAADGDGRVLARVRLRHPVLTPAAGLLEHDPRVAWVDGPRAALSAIASEVGGGPAGVAVSALTPSLAGAGDDGRPLPPGVLYDDQRGRPDGAFDGDDPTRSPEGAAMLAWLRRERPAPRYLPAQAVANAALGGPAVVDLATAMSMGTLFDGSGWTGEAADRLPGVRLFGEPIGRAGGAVLGAGSVDAFCEQLVTGPLGEGDALVVLGSTLVVWASVPDHRHVDGLWCLPQLDGGRWLLGGASNAGGLWTGWADRVLAAADPAAARPGAVPLWLPYLRGERVPLHDPARRAGLVGGAIDQAPADLRRAALEASAFAARHILERSGATVRRLVVAGGGSASRPWVQALADVTGLAAVPVSVPEGAALGAAWLARVAAGLEEGTAGASRWASSGEAVLPEPAWAEACAARYVRFRTLSEQGSPWRGGAGE